MDRRSFLTLILATPLVPVLAKLAPVVPPEPVIAFPTSGELARYVLPFAPDAGFSTLIPAGRIARFVARPQLLFRPDRLMISGSSRGLELLNVSSTGEPQLDEAVPAEIFSPASFGSVLAFAPVPPGQIVVLAVLNRSKETARFNAAMVGDAPSSRA